MNIEKYKIAYMKGNPDKEGKVKIYVRVMSGTKDIRISTPVRIIPSEYKKGKIIKNPLSEHYNTILKNKRIEVEKIILNAIIKEQRLDKILFENKYDSDFEAFVMEHIKLNEKRFSEKRLRFLEATKDFALDFQSKLRFSDIDASFLQKFENWIRNGREDSSVLSKMSAMLSFLNAAAKKGLIDNKQYAAYSRPKVKEKIPDYLTEAQIDKFYEEVKKLSGRKQNTGFYFLLSCYTGYRLSDCKLFDYDKNVSDGIITLRAKKNGNIVSMPIYPKLAEILNYCRKNKFLETEQHARKTVKEICKTIKMQNSDKIKFHSGRHSFAMYCLSKGFSIEKTAEFLGDSVEVATTYARIINPELHKEVRERLF